MSTSVMCTEYVTKVVHINQKLERNMCVSLTRTGIHTSSVYYFLCYCWRCCCCCCRWRCQPTAIYVLTAINKNTLTISGHVFLFSTICSGRRNGHTQKAQPDCLLSTIDQQIKVIVAGTRMKWPRCAIAIATFE